jgi:hypothetical protein
MRGGDRYRSLRLTRERVADGDPVPAVLSGGGHGAALGELDFGGEVASGQVGGHKGWSLRQVEVQVGFCADLDRGFVEGEVDDVSATGAVFGEEVQMVAGDSQALGVVGVRKPISVPFLARW